jgi:hypothetical protein
MNRAVATALIAAACLCAPAAASASTVSTAINRHADRAALNAYATYLQALAAGKTSAADAEQLFSSTTTTTCYKALAPIATSQSVPAGTGSALTSIGDEIGADAGLQFLSTAQLPMSELATSLASLHWGSGGPSTTVKRFLTASEALMALAPSNLCGDANNVASQAGEQQVTTPPATLTFLSAYQAASTVANTRLTAFVKLLDNYATATDTAVATKIDLLAVKVNQVSTAAITAGTKSLFHALGIPAAASAAAAPQPAY